MNTLITRAYLKSHPEEIFVFGDNLKREGKGGAAILRDCVNTYGFITKKFPSHDRHAYYHVYEYDSVYRREIFHLQTEIMAHPGKTYLISKVGAGLANKFKIFEHIIEPNIKKDLSHFPNVKFLW